MTPRDLLIKQRTYIIQVYLAKECSGATSHALKTSIAVHGVVENIRSSGQHVFMHVKIIYNTLRNHIYI